MTFWNFHFLKIFQWFSFVFRIWPPKSLSKNVWSKLSPTPTKIFCLDFFLRKPKTKLNCQKLLFFSKTFLFFDFLDHSDPHMILKKWCVPTNHRFQQPTKYFSNKIIVFGGSVFVHLYRGKNPSKKALLMLEKVLTKLFFNIWDSKFRIQHKCSGQQNPGFAGFPEIRPTLRPWISELKRS